jgi:hypothetical protein
MRFFFTTVVLMTCAVLKAQLMDSLVLRSESILRYLRAGDSIHYYQCHVEDVGIQLSTASGQTLTGNPHRCSITEKFVIVKGPANYKVRYYSSSLTVLPNRKFSGLKIRERPYWNFRLEREFTLSEMAMRVLLAMERKGREAMEYDYVISKNNTNQIIIKYKKDFKQLVIEGDYVLSRLLSALP